MPIVTIVISLLKSESVSFAAWLWSYINYTVTIDNKYIYMWPAIRKMTINFDEDGSMETKSIFYHDN